MIPNLTNSETRSSTCKSHINQIHFELHATVLIVFLVKIKRKFEIFRNISMLSFFATTADISICMTRTLGLMLIIIIYYIILTSDTGCVGARLAVLGRAVSICSWIDTATGGTVRHRMRVCRGTGL